MLARAALLVVALGAGLTGCAGACASESPTETSTPVPAPTEQPDLTIYAAASLGGVTDAAKAAYEQTIGEVEILISTDSSAALATKIEQGAPADLFLSADTANAQRLVEAGLALGETVDFAGNELTIIVPVDNPAGIESPKDLAKDGVRIIAAGDEVPISKYAAKVVTRLADLPGYPDGYAGAYEANILSREENVSAVLAKIELGEGDAGIVYVTDAAAATDVETVRIPARANVQTTYAAVVLNASAHPNEAQAFLDWLQGAEGLAILQGFGFLPPPE
jgi:molybdate transport system substrate-binding protein